MNQEAVLDISESEANPNCKYKQVNTKLEQICNIDLSQIDSFAGHPYKVRDDEEMLTLAESIKEHGVLSPAIVRAKDEGQYELTSGHRRKRASELAGLTAIPVTILDISDEQSAVLIVDSNCQREKVLPSEKETAPRSQNWFLTLSLYDVAKGQKATST